MNRIELASLPREKIRRILTDKERLDLLYNIDRAEFALEMIEQQLETLREGFNDACEIIHDHVLRPIPPRNRT